MGKQKIVFRADARKYYGPRDESFREMLRNVLKTGGMKDKYIDVLLTPQSLDVYNKVFTSETAHPDDNLEYLEHVGDSLANCCVVMYFSRRYPELHCTAGKQVAARLRINYVSTDTFADVADSWGFLPFISASEEELASEENPEKLLEDVFEAFIGATGLMLDNHFQVGVGFALCYDMIACAYDKRNFSLRYEDVVDAKTRLKETFDFYRTQAQRRDQESPIGTQKKVKIELPGPEIAGIQTKTQRIELYSVPDSVTKRGGWQKGDWQRYSTLMGVGEDRKEKRAEQQAAAQAVDMLAQQGYRKETPAVYRTFCNT